MLIELQNWESSKDDFSETENNLKTSIKLHQESQLLENFTSNYTRNRYVCTWTYYTLIVTM